MNINICGGGRWAREILKETITIKKIKKINIFTNNEKLILEFKLNRKVNFYKKSIIQKIFNKDKTIICNKLKDHIFSAEIFLKNGSEVLIEKPVYYKGCELKKIGKYQNKISISKILHFNDQIKTFINKINLKKINEIELSWYDKHNEKRRGQKKIHEKKISYFYDILHHIINILEIIFPKRKFLNKLNDINFEKNSNNETIMNFKLYGIYFLIKLSRIKKVRKRILKLKNLNKSYILNFSDTNLQKNSKKKEVKFRYFEKKDNLNKMINHFLTTKNEKSILRFNNSKNYFQLYKFFFDT